MTMAPSNFLFILFLLLCSIFLNGQNLPNFPAIFIFGDSAVDSGNNNYLQTKIKSNHPPYGMDFPGKISTGRFSDGKLVPDFLASMLGIKQTVPPSLEPNLSDDDLRTGVNFASAGSGYDEQSNESDGVIPMAKQLEYFKDYIERLKKIVGDEEAEKIVSGALVVLTAGTVDIGSNFYDLPITRRNLQMSISQYQDFVLNKLQNFVKELYDLGCRVITISGLPPIGCLPVQITTKSPDQRCIQKMNTESQLYNVKLAKLLPDVQETLNGSTILYADIFNPLMDMINNPGKYGFVETKTGCCGFEGIETGLLCTRLSPVCPFPSQYMFFDGFHPNEVAYKYLTEFLVKELFSA